MTLYRFTCPTCHKTYTEEHRAMPRRDIHCGDCLMNKVEIVRMTCKKVAPAPATERFEQYDDRRWTLDAIEREDYNQLLARKR